MISSRSTATVARPCDPSSSSTYWPRSAWPNRIADPTSATTIPTPRASSRPSCTGLTSQTDSPAMTTASTSATGSSAGTTRSTATGASGSYRRQSCMPARLRRPSHREPRSWPGLRPSTRAVRQRSPATTHAGRRSLDQPTRPRIARTSAHWSYHATVHLFRRCLTVIHTFEYARHYRSHSSLWNQRSGDGKKACVFGRFLDSGLFALDVGNPECARDR